MKNVIHLWNTGGTWLIIEAESGFYYSNQVGGVACLHPEVQGMLVPIFEYGVDAVFTTPENFEYYPIDQFPSGYDIMNLNKEKHLETSSKRLDVIEKDIRKYFTEANTGYIVTIDRAVPNFEAWIRLKFERSPKYPIKEHYGYDELKPQIPMFEELKLQSFYAVLTEPNSD